MSARRSIQDGKQFLQSASLLASNLPKCEVKMFVMIEIEKEGMGMRKRKIWRSRSLAVLLSATMSITGVPGVGSEGLFSPVVKAEGEIPAETGGTGGETPSETPSQSLQTGTDQPLAEGITYHFSSSDGTLTLKGSGALTTKFKDTFSDYTAIKKVVFENDGITSIGQGVFEGCTGITEVQLNNTITSIGVSAFQGCTSITAMTFPETVEQLALDSFRNCAGLTDITINCPNIKLANGMAFQSCSNISSVTFAGSEKTWQTIVRADMNLAIASANVTYQTFDLIYNASANGGKITETNGDTITKEVKEKDPIPTASDATGVKAYKDGYDFMGWNNNRTEQKASENLTMPSNDTTLYAIFKKDITANFIGAIDETDAKNKNNGATVEQDTTNNKGTIKKTAYNTATSVTITLPKGEKATSNATGANQDLSFFAWSTSKDNRTNVKSADEEVSLSANATYYAVYQQDVTIIYKNKETQDSLQGDETSPTEIGNVKKLRYYVAQPGASTTYKIVEPPTFTLANALEMDGYNFTGWKNTTAGGTTIYDAKDVFQPGSDDNTAEYTFAAQWKEIKAQAPLITIQPQDVTAQYEDTGLTMQVTASPAETGVYNLTYEWYQKNNLSDPVGKKLSTDDTLPLDIKTSTQTYKLKLPDQTIGDTKYYYCVITATRKDNKEAATATTNPASFTISKADCTVTITNDSISKYFDSQPIEGIHYTIKTKSGKDITPLDNSNVTISYSKIDAGVETPISSGEPKEPGNYRVKVTFNQTDQYNASTSEPKDFTISYLPLPDPCYTLDQYPKNGYYKIDDEVTITAPGGGYEIKQGNYDAPEDITNPIKISDTSTDITAFLKKDDKYFTKTFKIPIKVDQTDPTGTVMIKNNIWKEFLESITFGVFFKETQTVTITGADAESGVKSIKYHIEKTEQRALTKDELKGLTDWTTYTAPFSIDPNPKCIVYAKIEDYAGNVAYINTEGLVFDENAPTLKMTHSSNVKVVAGETVYGKNVTYTVSDPNLASVTVDDIEYKKSSSPGKFNTVADNNIEFKGTFEKGNNKVHKISAADQAGNIMSEKTVSVYDNYTVTWIVMEEQ